MGGNVEILFEVLQDLFVGSNRRCGKIHGITQERCLDCECSQGFGKLEENIRRIPVMSAAVDDAAEPAIASSDTESDSQKMEHKHEEAEEASMDLDKEEADTFSESPKDAKE